MIFRIFMKNTPFWGVGTSSIGFAANFSSNMVPKLFKIVDCESKATHFYENKFVRPIGVPAGAFFPSKTTF